jgi:hypothetical protein
MKTLKLIAVLTVLTASSAFAADAPKADTQADAKPVLLASAATPAAAAAGVVAPAAQAKNDSGRSRAEVQREAVEAVRTYENTLSRDLSFYTK